jgi:hypothetical protein
MSLESIAADLDAQNVKYKIVTGVSSVEEKAFVLPPLSKWKHLVQPGSGADAYFYRTHNTKPGEVDGITIKNFVQGNKDELAFVVFVRYIGPETEALERTGSLSPIKSTHQSYVDFSFDSVDDAYKAIKKFLKKSPTFAKKFAANATVASNTKLPHIPALAKWEVELGPDHEHAIKYAWVVNPGRNFIEMYALGTEWRVNIHDMQVVPGFEFLKPKASRWGRAMYVRRANGEIYISNAAYPFSSATEAYKALKQALAAELQEQAKR